MIQSSNIPNEHLPEYAVNVYVHRGPDQETLVIGGQWTDDSSWSETLNSRAARALWFDLTRLLFPERSETVLAQVTTMQTMPRVDLQNVPAISISVQRDGSYVLSNWEPVNRWILRLHPGQVQAFWAQLDVALFPTGW